MAVIAAAIRVGHLEPGDATRSMMTTMPNMEYSWLGIGYTQFRNFVNRRLDVNRLPQDHQTEIGHPAFNIAQIRYMVLKFTAGGDS